VIIPVGHVQALPTASEVFEYRLSFWESCDDLKHVRIGAEVSAIGRWLTMRLKMQDRLIAELLVVDLPGQ